jgi:membrane associated rhomboid family serine protease
MLSRFPAVLSIFAGLFVHALIPRGAFGAYDVASRAAITGAVAGVTYLLILALNKRRTRSR